jgi:hypothetical protein
MELTNQEGALQRAKPKRVREASELHVSVVHSAGSEEDKFVVEEEEEEEEDDDVEEEDGEEDEDAVEISMVQRSLATPVPVKPPKVHNLPTTPRTAAP